jgi:hypothetical protein
MLTLPLVPVKRLAVPGHVLGTLLDNGVLAAMIRRQATARTRK